MKPHKHHIKVRAHHRAPPTPPVEVAAVPVIRGPVDPDDPAGGLNQPAIGLAKRGQPAMGPADFDDGYQR